MPRPRGNGAGWGGPAKGQGNGAPQKLLDAAGPGRGHMSVRGMEKRERIERWFDALDEIAMDLEQNPSARVSALNSLLDRTAGKPATVIEGGDPNRPVLQRVERIVIDPRDTSGEGIQAPLNAE